MGGQHSKDFTRSNLPVEWHTEQDGAIFVIDSFAFGYIHQLESIDLPDEIDSWIVRSVRFASADFPNVSTAVRWARKAFPNVRNVSVCIGIYTAFGCVPPVVGGARFDGMLSLTGTMDASRLGIAIRLTSQYCSGTLHFGKLRLTGLREFEPDLVADALDSARVERVGKIYLPSCLCKSKRKELEKFIPRTSRWSYGSERKPPRWNPY
jgi:hypothetical protein